MRIRSIGVLVVIGVVIGMLVSAAPARAAAPDTRPVAIFVHGFSPPGGICRSSFGTMADKFESQTSAADLAKRFQAVRYVGYYEGDRTVGEPVDGRPGNPQQCPLNGLLPKTAHGDNDEPDDPAPGTLDGYPHYVSQHLDASGATRIEDVAAAFALWVHDNYTNPDRPFAGKLEILGHSMGGAIVRHAIQRWPFFFFRPGTTESIVENTVLVGSPQNGANTWKDCTFTTKCKPCQYGDAERGTACWLQVLRYIFTVNCSLTEYAQCKQLLHGSRFLEKLNQCDEDGTACATSLDETLTRWWLIGSTAEEDPVPAPKSRSDGLVSAESAVWPRTPSSAGTFVSTKNPTPANYSHLTYFDPPPAGTPAAQFGLYTEPWIKQKMTCPC